MLPAFSDNYQLLDGQPLLVVFDGLGEYGPKDHPLNVSSWSFRWMASQLQDTPQFASWGYWSWM